MENLEASAARLTASGRRGFFWAVSVLPRTPCAPFALLLLLGLLLAAPLTAAEPPRDAAGIAARLAELRQDPARAKLLATPLGRVEATLARVRDARAANDTNAASQLILLAKEWLAIAEVRLRAERLEQERAAVDKKVLALLDTVSRTEILLEETLAARERTREQLERFRAQKRNEAARDGAR